MKYLLSVIKDFFRNFSFTKKTDAPAILYRRYYRILGMAALALAIMAACIVARILLAPTLVISFGVLALALFIYAMIFKYNLEARGYTAVRGKITFAKEAFSPTADSLVKSRTVKRPSYYLMRTENGETYRFAANKVDDELPVGSAVILYAPLDVATYERSGITYLAVMWAYELDSSEDTTEPYSEFLTRELNLKAGMRNAELNSFIANEGDSKFLDSSAISDEDELT